MAVRLRKHRRVAVDVGSGNGTPRVRDISICGARVQWGQALRIDDTIEIVLPYRSSHLKVTGHVVRARRTGLEELPYEYGVILGDLTPEIHERLLLFMDEKGFDEEPTTVVDSNQVWNLRERVDELESRLAEALRLLPNQATVAGDAGRSAPGVGEEVSSEEAPVVYTTQYDLQRFCRLLELGQPLVRMGEDTASLGELLPTPLADAFASPASSDGIDLGTIRRMARGLSEPESITSVLYLCYEKDLIDFA